MVPVSVKQKVGGKGNFLGETEGIGGQLVERKTGGVLDDDRCALNVGILGLHLVANEFTFTDLGPPSRVLVLDVNHR